MSRGRGRGRGKPFAGLESLLPGEPPPPPILTPPPLFPPMEKRPLELRKLPTDAELLALKENLRLYMQQSPFALKAGPEKQGIRRYSDKYIQLLESESNEFVSWRPDWRFFPSELRPGSTKRRRRVSSGLKPVVPSSRKRVRSCLEGGRGGGDGAGKDSAPPPGRKKVTFADDGKRVDPLSDVDESVMKEKEEEEGEGEEGEIEGEEEIYDEVVEEEDTDYNITYFDNGEDYGGNESDAVEEGPFESGSMEVGEDEDMMAEDIIMCEGAEAVAVGGGRDGLDIGTCDEEVPVYYSPHQHQISLKEYYRQAGEYTAEALRELKASPEFKAHIQKCLSCGSGWCDGEVGEDCEECGGHAMTKPCPLCQGQCGAVWSRSVDMSHSFHKAHWNGQCSLSEEQRSAMLLRTLVEPDSNELADAMQDLGT